LAGSFARRRSGNRIRDDASTELPMLRTHLKLAREALAANPKR